MTATRRRGVVFGMFGSYFSAWMLALQLDIASVTMPTIHFSFQTSGTLQKWMRRDATSFIGSMSVVRVRALTGKFNIY